MRRWSTLNFSLLTALARYDAQPARLKILKGLRKLLTGVHHEGAVVCHWLADRLAAHDVEIQGRGMAVLIAIRAEAEGITLTEDSELACSDGPLVSTNVTGAAKHICEGIEVLPPGNVYLSPRLNRDVDDGDGRVCDARALMPIQVS